VVQPGYMIGERVLRPALVGVAKARPKPPPAPPPEEVVARAEELAEEPVKEASANDNADEAAPDTVAERNDSRDPDTRRSRST
jgi:molecular chaperone GrpE